jgi:hypothetical protein
MEKDIDRLCLERALERFLESGKKEDAFDVYFCYLEMFVGSYKKTRRMIEMLSEFEANGSSLLMKHRDHYCHSVYVFALGLAIYESNSIYKDVYKKFYEGDLKTENEDKDIDNRAACHFLKYWGMASLFHDIGYPFELPFEQAASYFEVAGDKREERPYIAYNGLDSYVKLNQKARKKIGKIYGFDSAEAITTTDELFAKAISEKLAGTYYFSKGEMLDCLKMKPTKPNKFGHFMDHAYFSATVLFKKLFCEVDMELTEPCIDALTAIILHNSLYKFSVTNYKKPEINIPFELKLHPLAYLLMLCDELQCWDRVAYGRNSKTELHPMGATFDLSEDKIKVTYFYDEKESGKIKLFKKKYEEWKKNKEGDCPKLKAYSSMYIENEDGICDFLEDIQRIVSLKVVKKGEKSSTESDNEKKIELIVKTDIKSRDDILKSCSRYLSDSNFMNLYNFAVVLHGRWGAEDVWKEVKGDQEKEEEFVSDKERIAGFNEGFEKLSLEYKLSNINQAKGFGAYLNEIGCLYTDKQVDLEKIETFSGYKEEDMLKIGKMEHRRWLQEHIDMGWEYGDKAEFKEIRDISRKHWDMVPEYIFESVKCDPKSEEGVIDEVVDINYKRLDKAEQDKDTEPMECILAMLKAFSNVRVYKLK